MTTIEWTQRPGTKGETWNPIAGCDILSPGCTNCYAMCQAHRIQMMSGGRPTHYAGTTRLVKGKPVWTGVVTPAPDAIFLKPLRWKSPRTVFVNSMSDLFHEAVPDATIDRVFAIMALTPQHTYQVLTKRSARMREYLGGVRRAEGHATERIGYLISEWSETEEMGQLPNIAGVAASALINGPTPLHPDIMWPRPDLWPLPNVWLGVSAERQKEADERVPDLLATLAAIRFVSSEPLLGPIDFTRIPVDGFNSLGGQRRHVGKFTPNEFLAIEEGRSDLVPSFNALAGDVEKKLGIPALDQIIVGGESGPDARPMHPAWARQIRDQCAAAGTAFFFKQWGAWEPNETDHALHGRTLTGRAAHWVSATFPDGTRMNKVGKSRAGRLLDGREHTEWPVVRA